MDKKETVSDLAAQKKLLVAEADLHRRAVSMEIKSLRSSLSWVDKTVQTAKSMRPLTKLLAVGTGLFLAWRGRAISKWSLRGLALWRLGRRFWKS